MDLHTAANYFSDTPVEGWTGTSWAALRSQVTLLPHDRFISEREFGNKRRYLLTDPCDEQVSKHRVIRFPSTGSVFLVGVTNYDIQGYPYSKLQLLHHAPYSAGLYHKVPDVRASGMPGSNVRTLAGTYFCDVERVTFSNSKEFDLVRFSESAVILPSDCPVDTDEEVKVGDRFYDIREVYLSSGFKYCRALAKRSTV